MSPAIVIPLYKVSPGRFELTSLNQCYRILHNYPIIFVTSESFSPSNYPTLPTVEIKRFKDEYFKDLSGYNRLMMNSEFYETFSKFDFILLYQLDSYVFRNDLEYWCSLDYDYVGAPWFDDYGRGKKQLWYVGNGGFSLRKTKTFLNVLNKKVTIHDFSLLFNYHRHHSSGSVYYNSLISIKKSLTNDYKIGDMISRFSKNEDCFWSTIAHELYSKFTICPVEYASAFSFELHPEILYEQKNHQLPFGCHAFEKNFNFWRKFIAIDNTMTS